MYLLHTESFLFAKENTLTSAHDRNIIFSISTETICFMIFSNIKFAAVCLQHVAHTHKTHTVPLKHYLNILFCERKMAAPFIHYYKKTQTHRVPTLPSLS